LYFPRGPVISECCTSKEIVKFIRNIKKRALVDGCKKIILDCKYNIFKNKRSHIIEKSILENGFEKSKFSRFWHYNWGIDIEGISPEEYLINLNQKTRYNINYAKRKGLQFVIDNSEDSIKKFYELLKITAQRDKFQIKEYECYSKLFTKFNDDIDLFWVYKDTTLLSAAIYIRVGEQAYYVYGASSNKFKEYKPTYLMHYAMISYAISDKCKIYNMGGVGVARENKSYDFNEGLYNFKKKFGGFLQDSGYTYILEL
jgi:lipid II:glycine glycyltransferase (peptidoglycan interpeptide bridge formation enzyme)